MANNYQSGNGATRPTAALATPEQLRALAEITSDDVAKFAALLRLMLPNADKLTDAQIVAAAVYGKESGLDPISGQFYVTKEQGVMPGYKGTVKNVAKRMRPNWYHRRMTPEERELHGLGAQDYGSICILTDIETAVEMRKLGLEYHPTEGIGIVRYDDLLVKERWEGEYPNRRKVMLPKEQWQPAPPVVGRSHQWRAEIRSLKDACNRAPNMEWLAAELSETADSILEAGASEIPGFEWPPAEARLSKEQATAWVESQRRAERLRHDPAAQAAAVTAGRWWSERSALQRKYNDWQMATSDCPHCGAPEGASAGAHGEACPFRALVTQYTDAQRPPDIRETPRANNAAQPEPPVSEPPADVVEGAFRPVATEPSSADEFDSFTGALDELGIRQARADAALLEQVRNRLQVAAREGERNMPDERLLKHVRGSMSNLFGRDENTRRAVVKWAFNANSSNDLTAGMCRGLIDFIGSTKVGDEWVPSEQAVDFLRAFKRTALGQPELG